MMEYGPEQSCCFTGHRDSKLPWGRDEGDPRCVALKRQIADVAESLYDSGVRRYICGMALGCDMYFAEAVLELAERRGGVLLEAAIPCLGQDERWGEAQRARYARLLARCGRRTVLSHRYTPGCMEARNLYMVEQSHWLVAAYNGSRGGTFNTIRLALRHGLEIIELYI